VAHLADSRVILITGCSSPQGIGFATARALAAEGHRVHATVRDHSHDAELVAGLEDLLTVHTLELRDRLGMKTVLGEVVSDRGRLDVLINNAGYGLIGGIEQVDLDQARESFETNFFGTMALIQEVAPIMRRQQAGHIVNLSAIFAAGLSPPAIGYYIATKAALETACQALAVELAPWNVRVTNYQPGPVMTELEREWGRRLEGDDDPRPTLSDELYNWIVEGDGPDGQPPEEVAAVLCELIDSPPPGLAEQSGAFPRAYVEAGLSDPTRAAELDAMLAAFARARAAVSESS
jgi:retinol dehydrogenase-8